MHFNIHFIHCLKQKKLRTYNEFPVYFWKRQFCYTLKEHNIPSDRAFHVKIIFDQARYISIDTEVVPLGRQMLSE